MNNFSARDTAAVLTYLLLVVFARLGLAIVPLCRGTGAPFDEHRRPLAPSNFLIIMVTISVDRQHYR